MAFLRIIALVMLLVMISDPANCQESESPISNQPLPIDQQKLTKYHYIPKDERKSDSCDSAASAAVHSLAFAFEALANEIVDGKAVLNFNEVISRIVEADALQYIVGPHYRFAGGTPKCEVLLRMNRLQDKWIIEGTSLKGESPNGSNTRYVYKLPVWGGKELPPAIETDITDAKNGKATDWNSYPYNPSGQISICYTESIIQIEESQGQKKLKLRIPKGKPCSDM